MVDTWTPPVPPSPPLPKMITPRLLQAQFGDGYAAVAPDGINTMLLDPFELQFNDIDPADAETMNTFMKTQGGYQRFLYTLPHESTPRKFRGTKFGIEQTRNENSVNFRVTLTEVP